MALSGHALWRQGYDAGFADGTEYGIPGPPKVRLYLDFDGVINAGAHELAWLGSDPGFGVAYGEPVAGPEDRSEFRSTWAKDLVTAIRRLDVDLVWATTWTKSAPTVLGPQLGLGTESRFLTPVDGVLRYPTMSWKEPAVYADLGASPSPFIWVDDELTNSLAETVYATFGEDALVITPDYWTGVTPAQIEQMKDFIAKQGE
jgi:hypothetical protein